MGLANKNGEKEEWTFVELDEPQLVRLTQDTHTSDHANQTNYIITLKFRTPSGSYLLLKEQQDAFLARIVKLN